MPVGDNLRSLPVITTRRGSCEYSRCVCSFLVVVECTWTVLASPRACVFMYTNHNTKHYTCWIKEPSDLFRKSPPPHPFSSGSLGPGSAWLNSGVARFLRRSRVRSAGFTPPLADGRGARLFSSWCVCEDRAGVSRHRLLAPHVCDVSVLQPLFRASQLLVYLDGSSLSS